MIGHVFDCSEASQTGSYFFAAKWVNAKLLWTMFLKTKSGKNGA
jgi:hypothetical protein